MKPEILSPGGDIESIKAAIAAGADAVYCGLHKFNARNRATNINIHELPGIIQLAHSYNCKIYITINILIVESELVELVGMLNDLANTDIDGVIIQDIGVLYIVYTFFKSLPIHASTQLNTHNKGQISFLNTLAVKRVNLARELKMAEVSQLCTEAHRRSIEVEVFVHGSYCICFSGICYMSSVLNGTSGNRGRCSQPCRDVYETTPRGNSYPLNLKDNSAYSFVGDLCVAGVDSLKIEGRIKNATYVYTVVEAWRKLRNNYSTNGNGNFDTSPFFKVFNRDFNDGFLAGKIGKDMFIDNPRDFSALHKSKHNALSNGSSPESAKEDVYNERSAINAKISAEISKLSTEKTPVTIYISGKMNSKLQVRIKNNSLDVEFSSQSSLSNNGKQPITHTVLMQRFKSINDTAFCIESIDTSNLDTPLYLPFTEMNYIKKAIIKHLRNGKDEIPAVELPKKEKRAYPGIKPHMSVLLSSTEDIATCAKASNTCFFEIPSCLHGEIESLLKIFSEHNFLIPWFQPVLIGDDFEKAKELLDILKPRRIVTNNTGLIQEANKRGISWIAGPHLNIVNSYSLTCLKKLFGCSGAFISNELNRIQIKSIQRVDTVELFFTIYQPIELMTSRQCLFQQIDGCSQTTINDNCLSTCNRQTTITNSKAESFLINKSTKNYHHVYKETNYLNTEIISDLPVFFNYFNIDLRRIKTRTQITTSLPDTLNLFHDLVQGTPGSAQKTHEHIHPTEMSQYSTGV